MVTKLFGFIAVAALAVSGPALVGSSKSCCAPGADCCYPGSPCCTECCYPGSECCYPGSPCCAGEVGSLAAYGPGEDTKPVELTKAPAKAGCKCCAAEDGKGEKAADKPAKVDPKAVTLTVDGMTCAGCAKSVTKSLAAVENVESVVVDVKAKTATVTPKAGKSPSAKDLWEAVEKAEYKPTKLEGPDGTFEKKPTK